MNEKKARLEPGPERFALMITLRQETILVNEIEQLQGILAEILALRRLRQADPGVPAVDGERDRALPVVRPRTDRCSDEDAGGPAVAGRMGGPPAAHDRMRRGAAGRPIGIQRVETSRDVAPRSTISMGLDR